MTKEEPMNASAATSIATRWKLGLKTEGDPREVCDALLSEVMRLEQENRGLKEQLRPFLNYEQLKYDKAFKEDFHQALREHNKKDHHQLPE